jgi:hypothetical protein
LLVGELGRSVMSHRLTVGDRMVSLVEEDYRVAHPVSQCNECGACRGGSRKSVVAVAVGSMMTVAIVTS